MKNWSLIGLFCLILAVPLQAQKKYSTTKKISNAKGTLWGYWGYNRSVYSKSDLRFVGPGYDFTLRNATASDNPSRDLGEYVNIARITVPQFNTRVGYYYKDRWAISLGYDHMKYIFDDANQVLIDGNIDKGIDSTWSGTYRDQAVVTNRNDFHYENSNGLNYIRVELTRTDKLYQSKNKIFALSSNLSLGAGCVLTINDFKFGEQIDRFTASISGFGVSGHASLRLEFFRHFFLQGELSGGRLNLPHVRTRREDKSAYAQQKYWYGQRNITAGFLLYLKPGNTCQDCPVW